MVELRRYICAVLIVLAMGLNSYSINKNIQNYKLNMQASYQKPSYEYLKSVTVFIKGSSVVNQKLHEWIGTGIIVKMDTDTYILVNRHMINKTNGDFIEIKVPVYDEDFYCEIVKVYGTADLALLKVKGRLNNKAVVKGFANPTITEKVYSVGNGLGRPFLYTEGIFSGEYSINDIYQMSTIWGQSGGGVFNKNGEVLGLIFKVNAFKGKCKSNHFDFTRGYAIKSIYIQKFLKESL